MKSILREFSVQRFSSYTCRGKINWKPKKEWLLFFEWKLFPKMLCLSTILIHFNCNAIIRLSSMYTNTNTKIQTHPFSFLRLFQSSESEYQEHLHFSTLNFNKEWKKTLQFHPLPSLCTLQYLVGTLYNSFPKILVRL